MPDLKPLTIIVRGEHDTGKTTTASFIKMWLDENGYESVVLRDLPPLSVDEKEDFFTRRLPRTRKRPISIRVELESAKGGGDGRDLGIAAARAAAFFDAIDKRDMEKMKSALATDKWLLLLELAELFAERGA